MFVVIFALAFVIVTLGVVNGAEIMKIEPKGKKKLNIAVVDWNAAIEVGAYCNKWHIKGAKERGWEAKIFDLKGNNAQAEPIMENIIGANFDGVIIHWTTPTSYEVQLKKAFQKGIPVITVAGGQMLPGIVGDFGMLPGTAGGLIAEYLSNKLKPGDKVLAYYIPDMVLHRVRYSAAKGVFDGYGIVIAQILYYTSGDPSQQCYESIKNALLADTKKEIKAIWTPWEGFGIPTARAAMDTGRKEIMVVTLDDSPNTYSEFRNWPTLYATAGTIGLLDKINGDIFKCFDKVFAGAPVETQKVYGYVPYIVARDDLPPKGYFFNYCGYKGRPPDFEVK